MLQPKISHRLNMGLKTRLGFYCTKRANNGVNLVTSRKINTRLARPMVLNYKGDKFVVHCEMGPWSNTNIADAQQLGHHVGLY